MDVIDKLDIIQEYLTLPMKIEKARSRLACISTNYYATHSFTSVSSVDIYGNIYQRAPTPPCAVEEITTAERITSRRIQRLEWRYEQFKHFLNELTADEVKTLSVQNNVELNAIQKACYEEIEQIEEALTWREHGGLYEDLADEHYNQLLKVEQLQAMIMQGMEGLAWNVG